LQNFAFGSFTVPQPVQRRFFNSGAPQAVQLLSDASFSTLQ
jgi:hypothetical protein